MTTRTRVLLSSFLMLGCSLPAFAQSARGTITGLVRDATGAVVPGVDLTITEKATGVITRTVSTEAGAYRAPYIPPGNYHITASLAGFKTAVADNIQVLVGQTVTVDFNLEIGQLSDQVTVMAQTPLLEASNPEIGINTTEKEVHTWPIIVSDGTRQLQTFMFNSLPGTEGGTFAGSINGGQAFSHEILVDGISIGRMDLNGGSMDEFTPTMDSVSEFKLQTGALSAQYGNTQTALTNFGMRSGTNVYHGSAFWFHNEPFLNANSWANNAQGAPNTGSKQNNFGGTVGGPIWKDRTFFFFSYEGNRQTNQNLAGENGTMPIRAFKNGDFSQLLDPAFTGDERSGTVVGADALGRPIVFGQIYDPASSRQMPDGTWIRDPFPGNIIPSSRFSATTVNVLKYDVPDPPLDTFRRNQPWVDGCCPFLNIDNYSIKLDQVVNNKHKFSVSFVDNDRSRKRFGGGTPQLPGDIPQPPMGATKLQATPGQIIRFAEDWTISPTVVNHFAYGYNRFMNANQSYSYLQGQDWATLLGLTNVGSHAFPVITWQGYDSTLGSGLYQTLGGVGGTGFDVNGSNIIGDDLTWIRGSHSFRFGFEHRRYYENSGSVENTGSYQFSNENTALPGYRLDTGFTYASFMLGAIRSTSLYIPFVTTGNRSRVTSFYVQDDWKARGNLTLNFGLRWDIPTAVTEVRQRQSGLDPSMPNPGADGYPGAMVMLGDCQGCNGKGRGRSNRMVIRGGYGINFSPPIADFGWFNYQAGFDGSNPINAYTNSLFREDPSHSWDSPYPPFTQQLPNPDPALMNGDYIGWYMPSVTRYPYVQNWNFGIQYELPWQVKVEANYVGNRGLRLNESNYSWTLNQVNPEYLSLGDTLVEDINDHPEIPKPYPGFEGSVGQALRPFAQYYGVSSHRLNGGFSNYNALQVTVTKRSSYGLSFLAAYTFGKALGTADVATWSYYDYGQDWYNRKSDYSVTQYSIPQDFKLSWIYNLPFGTQGRWYKSGPMSYVLGGWTMSAIQRYRSGDPLKISTWTYGYDIIFNPGYRPDVLLPRSQQTLAKPKDVEFGVGAQYLNPEAFADLPSTANGVPLHLGNAPRWQPNLRGFAQFSEDFSLIKQTRLKFTEAANFEIRMDVINLFNRTRLKDPEPWVSDMSSFGQIFGKTGGPRIIQLGLRISF
ncbi:MAG: hypothetical protein H6Q05_4488 [Acidobacteria bacterium]|nr:hypothetical protein [Acidobacteriota bacterium]